MKEVKIFIASSNELQTEREAVHKLKDEVGKAFRHLKLELVKWETDMPSGSVAGKRIQDDINQLLEDCQIVFVLFYSKAGDFTVEELRLAESQGKKVFVYFKKGFSPQNSADIKAFSKAIKLREKLITENRILFKEYSNGLEFEKAFKEDLQKQLRILEEGVPTATPTPPLPAPLPLRGIRVVQSHALVYRDLDAIRPLPKNLDVQAYYYGRPSDEPLSRALTDPSERFIVVKGNPLAGKTRAVVEALRHLDDTDVLIPDIDQAERWTIESAKKDAVLVFDDFDQVCEKLGRQHINEFLRECFKQDIRVLATCKIGPEYAILQQTVDDKFWENVTEIEVEKLDLADFEVITQALKGKEIELDQSVFDRLDRNIGAFFLDIKTMRRRYERYGKNDLKRAVMQTLKVLRAGFNYLPNGAFDIEKVKEYTEICFNKDFSHAEWRNAFEGLEESNLGDGFIRFDQKRRHIFTEDAYLRVIVGMSQRECINEIYDLFPSPKNRMKFGFFGVKYWTVKLNEMRGEMSLEEGFQFLQDMSAEGIQPNTFTFTSLIPLCKNLEQGLEILEKMEEAKVECNAVTFSSLIPLCKDLDQGFEILEKMRAANFEPDTFTFNSLVPLGKDLSQGFEVLRKMEEANVERDTVTFTSLIPLCKDLNQGFEIIERMEAANIERNTFTFTSLIPLCKDLEQGFEILKKMEEANVEYNTFTFTSLIPLCKDLDQAFEILEKMEAANVERNTVTFTSLIPLCKDLEQGFEILERMEEANIERNTFTFTSLIPLCKDLDQAFKILEKMEMVNIPCNAVTFNSLIPLCKDLDQGFEVIERMEAAEVERDTITFNSLFMHAKSVDDGIAILEKAKGIFTYLGSAFLYKLLKLSKTTEELALIEATRLDWGAEAEEGYLKKLNLLQIKYSSQASTL